MTVYQVSVPDCKPYYYPTLTGARETRDILEQGDEFEATIDSIEVNNEEELCTLLTELANG